MPLVDPVLVVEGLSVERGGRRVLSDLNFTLSRGETLLVSGRNGAGKSTLLRTLAGLLQPSAGTIRCSLADAETRAAEAMHYLGYEDALKPSLTVGENLDFWASMLAVPAPRGQGEIASGAAVLSPRDALAAYGIARLHDLPAAYLSAGQKRRVALARLLLAWRPIWLLDEPLIALDTAAQDRTVDLMAAHARAGGTILVASHQPLANTTGRIELDVGMNGPLVALFTRELRTGRRIGGGAALGVVFFLILVTLIPFGVGPDLNLLSRIGPAILWIAALLATLLGLDRLFQSDRDDGSLDLILMSRAPAEAVVLVKCAAHWLLTGLPLVAATPIFGLMLGMQGPALLQTTASLAVGTPALTLLGAIGAALTVGLRKGGLLMAILILPLSVPILIFGVSAATAGLGNPVPFTTPFLILCALTLAAVAGTPFAAAAALRAMAE